MKSCANCKYRFHKDWFGSLESCLDYEMGTTEQEWIEAARECKLYEEGDPECLEEDEYCPSATAGDYSPSNPWAAPGLSTRDFI